MCDAFTVGKFMPFHKGHSFMIKYAYGSIKPDKMLILVDGTAYDSIPVSVRAKLIEQHLQSARIPAIVDVVNVPVQSKSYDQYGTSTDPDFWDAWIEEFQDKCEEHKLDANKVFFSSDMYGKEVSSRLGCFWLPIDPDREVYDTSGTRIRSDLSLNWGDITPEYQKYLSGNDRGFKNIAIVGPESTGKTTITKMLARKYKTMMVPEYGRTVSVAADNKLSAQNFTSIVYGQIELFDTMIKDNPIPGRFVFWDTDAITTFLFSEIYLPLPMPSLKDIPFPQIDLTIILKPTEFFEDDGWRVIPDFKKRLQFYKDLKNQYDQVGRQYVEIDAMQPLPQMIDQIDQLIHSKFRRNL